MQKKEITKVEFNIKSIKEFIKLKPSTHELRQLQAQCRNLKLEGAYEILQEGILDSLTGWKGLRNYEVYVVKDNNGEYLYIGSGLHGRHKHCQSGTSHSYELNAMHHRGEVSTVGVICTGLTQKESLAQEKELIIKHFPKFNKTHKPKEKKSVEIEDVDFNSKEEVLNFIEENPDDIDTMKAILRYTNIDEISSIVREELDQWQ